jgi:hypothetical protein
MLTTMPHISGKHTCFSVILSSRLNLSMLAQLTLLGKQGQVESTYGTNRRLTKNLHELSMGAHRALGWLAAVAGAVLNEGVDSGAMPAPGRAAIALAVARRGAARSGSRG